MDAQAHKPKPSTHLTDVEIAEILTLHHEGHSERNTAKIMHRSKTAVHHALDNYDFDTFVTQNPRSHVPRKTTKREDRYILRAAKQFNDVPLKDISKIVNIPVSRSTVSRRIHEAGYGRYIARKKPHLSSKNIKERLEWAIAHKDWSEEHWKKVIWSDETVLQIGHSSRRKWVTRKRGQELNKENVDDTYKTARLTIMVWACFSGEKVGPLMVFDEGGVGSEEYIDVILDGLLSFVDDLLGHPEEEDTIRVHKEHDFIFMQDNASCHKTLEVLHVLEEEGIPVMKWPAQSPDLNPLENIWVDFKDLFHTRFLQLYGRPSKSADACYRYKELAKQIWSEIGQGLVDRHINSMPKRCQAVIDNSGLWSGY